MILSASRPCSGNASGNRPTFGSTAGGRQFELWVNKLSLKQEFVKAVENLEEQHAMELAEQLKQSGSSQLEIVDLLMLGMKLVGLRSEGGEYFIADLIMSGIIFRSILNLDGEPEMPHRAWSEGEPCVVVGTVEGDLHDIGKDIFISMLEAQGLHVIDLGIDVAPEQFVKSIEQYRPGVVVLSGTMTFAAESMRRTVDLITERGLRDQVKIAAGGSAINQETVLEIGADAYSADLISGSALCKRWLEPAEAK